MKHLLSFSLIISFILGFSQTDSLQTRKRKAFIGIDLAQPIMQFAGDKVEYEVTASFPLGKKWQIAAELGYGENKVNSLGWIVDIDGIFGQLGANWVIGQDYQNPNMNYYLGGRIGYSKYNQDISQYPIEGTDVTTVYGSLPKTEESAVWMEPLFGAHVPIGESNFYIDGNAGIVILLNSSKSDGIESFAIPGFGKNNNGVNFRIVWSIGYSF